MRSDSKDLQDLHMDRANCRSVIVFTTKLLFGQSKCVDHCELSDQRCTLLLFPEYLQNTESWRKSFLISQVDPKLEMYLMLEKCLCDNLIILNCINNEFVVNNARKCRHYCLFVRLLRSISIPSIKLGAALRNESS